MNQRALSMFQLFAVMLGQGLAGANKANGGIPLTRQFGGTGKYRRRSFVRLTPAEQRARKKKKRIENKSRAINAKRAKR